MSLNYSLAVQAGRLTATPEIKVTASGIPKTTFRIATNRRYKTKNGETTADFVECEAWQDTAEHIVRYFTKGMAIMVTGELHSQSWTTESGEPRYRMYLKVSSVDFVESKKSEMQKDFTTEEFSSDDDLPF